MKKQSAPGAIPIVPIGLRRFLYLTAAITGAAILIVEILGAKMLSPYVGTSHFVWTAQIAVTLVALATGYYFGGRLVDRSQKLSHLYACIFLAAIYLSLTVLICEPVAYWCLQFKLAAGALLASAFLFFVPLTLLATAGPFLVRVLTVSVSGVGGNVGRLTAISTVGSVAGTVLIGYLLIPFVPNSVTMYVTAIALMALVSVYFLIWGRKSRPLLALVMGVSLGLVLGYGGVRRDAQWHLADTLELYRGNSNFGLLQVIENQFNHHRFYLNDYLTQNTFDPQSKQSLSMFTYMLHDLAHAYAPQVQDVLCIGLGVGIVPMAFAREDARVDVVDINPAVVPVASRFFDCQPDRFNLVIGDGRYFINRAARRYDAVVLDAFLGDSTPSHLLTREAFAGVQRILKPGGALVINCFGDFEPGHDFLTASLDKTLKAVFRGVRIHHAGNGNVFFVAGDQAELKILHPPNLQEIPDSVRSQVEAAFAGVAQTNPDHGRVLTDDFNPLEYYDAVNRERLRSQLAHAMRRD
ncbi:MAG: spermidine synthase [Limisphaerales bacterium]